jgi:hypothetical protein
MKSEFSSNLLHNPFHNRFNVPVTQRRDSMHAHANVVWLHQYKETALTDSTMFPLPVEQTTKVFTSPVDELSATSRQKSNDSRSLADWFPLLLVIIVSIIVLLKLF